VADLELQLNDSIQEAPPPSPDPAPDTPDHEPGDTPGTSAPDATEAPTAAAPSSDADSAAHAAVDAMSETLLRARAREEQRRLAAGEPPVNPATRDLVIARLAQLPDPPRNAFDRELELVAETLRRAEAAGPPAPRTAHEHPVMADLRRDIAQKITSYGEPTTAQPNDDRAASHSASPTGQPPSQRTSSDATRAWHAALTAATTLHPSAAPARRTAEGPSEHRQPVVPPRCSPDPGIARPPDGRGR
jgi:hypothetical protein